MSDERPRSESGWSDRRGAEARSDQTKRARLAAKGSPWRPVAAVSAIALGAIGAAAATRLGLPAVVGAAAGGSAAVLAVLALPSLPTRQVAVVMLGLAGLGALRHAALPTTDSALIVVWAAATLVALVLIDRAESERAPELPGGRRVGPRVPEAIRAATLISAIVIAVAMIVVPTATEQLSRRVWPGVVPTLGDDFSAPSSLRASSTLDMRSRPRLSDRVVFTVDAPRPDFWRGEVYDQWDGQVWTRSLGDAQPLPRRDEHWQVLTDPLDDGARHGAPIQQTFHIETGFSEVVFAAPSPVEVQTNRFIYGRSDGTALVRGGFGKGAVYTVTSRSSLPTADDLRAADARPIPRAVLDQYADLPTTTTRVRELAEQITDGQPTAYDKIKAIETWLSQHTRYSLDAPLSPHDVDVVDYFLFDSRLGWCEQVASSMTVLARSVGIPARLATGFVPGEKDGLSGRFVVRERDAHAWTEIYFPGVGWQGFDPTASVPLAGDAPHAGSWLEALRRHAAPVAIALIVLCWLVLAAPNVLAGLRRRLTTRPSWAARAQRRLERVGRRLDRPRRAAETPREYAQAVAEKAGDARLAGVGETIDHEEFAPGGAAPLERDAADALLEEFRRVRVP